MLSLLDVDVNQDNSVNCRYDWHATCLPVASMSRADRRRIGGYDARGCTTSKSARGPFVSALAIVPRVQVDKLDGRYAGAPQCLLEEGQR